MTAKLNDALVKPALEIAQRILDIFLLPDCSSSMSGLKIATLNQAFREVASEISNESKLHPDVEYRMRCIAFDDHARWHIGPEPLNINQVSWADVSANGCTSTGAAVQMLADAIRVSEMPKRGVPPVMVLVSDGANTDGNAYDKAIEALEKEPWGSKAVRLSIGVGSHFDRLQLEKFTNHPEVGVLEAKNAVDLVSYIRYATITASKAANVRNSPVALLMTIRISSTVSSLREFICAFIFLEGTFLTNPNGLDSI